MKVPPSGIDISVYASRYLTADVIPLSCPEGYAKLTVGTYSIYFSHPRPLIVSEARVTLCKRALVDPGNVNQSLCRCIVPRPGILYLHQVTLRTRSHLLGLRLTEPLVHSTSGHWCQPLVILSSIIILSGRNEYRRHV